MKAFIFNWKTSTGMCNALGGLAKRHDFHNMQRAWYLIRDTNHAHDAVDKREKKQATMNIQSIMKAIWRRKMTNYLSKLRNGAYQECKEHRNLR
jgi:regulator of replication initiation timing